MYLADSAGRDKIPKERTVVYKLFPMETDETDSWTFLLPMNTDI